MFSRKTKFLIIRIPTGLEDDYLMNIYVWSSTVLGLLMGYHFQTIKLLEATASRSKLENSCGLLTPTTPGCASEHMRALTTVVLSVCEAIIEMEGDASIPASRDCRSPLSVSFCGRLDCRSSRNPLVSAWCFAL